jgi:hypothetical protein
MALGQVFSEYFGFPCQFSFHRLLHIHHHLSSRAGTIGQLVADVPSGLSLTPPQENKKICLLLFNTSRINAKALHTRLNVECVTFGSDTGHCPLNIRTRKCKRCVTTAFILLHICLSDHSLRISSNIYLYFRKIINSFQIWYKTRSLIIWVHCLY